MMKVGGTELLIILIVCLFAIGPERMPKVARMLGRSLAAFKKSMNEATSELREISDEFKDVTDEIAGVKKEMRKAIRDAGEELEKAEKEAEQAVEADGTAEERVRENRGDMSEQNHADDHDVQREAADE